MTNATIRPLRAPLSRSEREGRADEFAELLVALADLGAKARSERQRLERLASSDDPRIGPAVDGLAALERHAHEVGAEAARVHNELAHARLI